MTQKKNSILKMPLRIYVENIPDRDPAYRVTEEAIRSALAGIAEPSLVVERLRDEPDIGALSQCNVLIGAAFDTSLLREHGKALRVVHSTSAGVESLLPLDWLPADCVLVNSSGVHADKAGKFGLLALLMLNDRIPQYATNQREHVWNRTLCTPIKGKRVLIYGVGALGGAVAEKAKLLGLEVWGIRRTAEAHSFVDRMFLPQDFDGIVGQVDFVVVTAPLTDLTRGAIGTAQISRIKPGAGFINMARSALGGTCK